MEKSGRSMGHFNRELQSIEGPTHIHATGKPEHQGNKLSFHISQIYRYQEAPYVLIGTRCKGQLGIDKNG